MEPATDSAETLFDFRGPCVAGVHVWVGLLANSARGFLDCARAGDGGATMPRRLCALAAKSTRAGPRLTVAVLYSGRFYGELTSPAWSKDHLENLIVPNSAAVFVVADPLNVCDKSSAVQHAVTLSNSFKWETASLALLQEAKAVFGGWPNLYAKVVPPVAASDVDKKFKQVRAIRASPSQCPFSLWTCSRPNHSPPRADAPRT